MEKFLIQLTLPKNLKDPLRTIASINSATSKRYLEQHVIKHVQNTYKKEIENLYKKVNSDPKQTDIISELETK